MEVTKLIEIDLATRGVTNKVDVVQFDDNTRIVKTVLYENGLPWTVPDGVQVVVSYTKPDKTIGMYDQMPDGSVAATVEDNVIYIKLAPQVMTVKGVVWCNIVIYAANGDALSTFPFNVLVAPNQQAEAMDSSNYINMGFISFSQRQELTDEQKAIARENIGVGEGGCTGGGGTLDHNDLANRDMANQHPMSAITGLEDALAGKQPTGDYLKDGDVPDWAKAERKPTYSKSEVGLGNVANERQYSANNPPPYPVTSVNGKTGAVTLSIPDSLSDLSADSTHRTVTDAEKTAWNAKLNASELGGAIDDALAQAKESGEFDGADGYTPVRGTDYWTAIDKQEIKSELTAAIVTQEAGESESLVMSQRAVTDLVNDALGENATTEYETVDSVDDMTDTSKSYVLSSTGTVWAYGEVTVDIEPTNKFVPSKATLNQRHGTSSMSAANGLFVTDYIAVEKFTEADPYIMRAFKSDGVGFDASVGNQRIHYFDASKTLLGNKYLTFDSVYATTDAPTLYDENNNAYWFIDKQYNYNDGGSYTEVTDFDHSKVAYVRVTLAINGTSTAITAADVANVIITFDADAGTVTESQWYDTGMTPSTGGGGGGGNYVDLLVKVNENKANIAELDSRVIALETDADTLTVPSFWKDAVDACISKIKALQIGRNCITFPFFSDNHQRNGYSGLLIAYIMKECNIPYAFFGGDSIDSGYIASEAVMIAQDKAFDTAMSYIPNGRFCRAVGNHDGYWAVDASNKNYYTDAQNYELFLREESIAQNKHFGGDGTYYYVDDVASKVRFIVLDTNDGTVETEQITWMQNTALSFGESGWAVVFISHQPISNHYHAGISNAAAVRTVVQNYINGSATNKADVAGWYSGHIHRDRIYTGIATNTTDDAQGTAMGFTQVTITSDHTSIAYDDATKHTVAQDDQSHAIDFVTINKVTRTVNLTRLGIGNDRSYSY